MDSEANIDMVPWTISWNNCYYY